MIGATWPAQLIDFAIKNQDDYVLIFEYTSGGVTRRRFVSPYKIHPGVFTLEGLCLTRQETRQFKIQNMRQIMLACAHDFVMPVEEMILRPVKADYQPALTLSDDKGAEFSPCRTWRYALWREWDFGSRCNRVAFVGLNPSTADETADDPTIRRCIRFAKDWGYDGLVMLNAYGFRATDPADLKAAADPVGPGNDEAIARLGRTVEMVVAAWGVHCSTAREQEICKIIGRTIHCLGFTKDGRPKHPLYLRADSKPVVFHAADLPKTVTQKNC